MSGLTFRLKAAPDERLDLSELTPAHLAQMSAADISKLVVGTSKRQLTVGDLFTVSGKPGDRIVIQGGSTRLDFIGAGLSEGTMIVEGDAGICAGRSMRGGKLEIRGDAGAWLASDASGGLVHLKGSAAGMVGGLRAGDRFGMTGGTVVVDGDAGDRVGERMRRGIILVRGRCGTYAGARMIGGTIWAEQGFGAAAGLLLRRGTLIGPSVDGMLPTFADAGKHDLVILRVLSRYLAATLGALAPRPLPASVRKFSGDLATIGKGEILITA
ncbi:MAG TPA: formylmethanofuran dehydrogenase subunit C [Hyphomicrobium sp.]|jgi:formylmethanofuran dehydrogenase subunit C